MESRRWMNTSQPQTLQIAVFLLYADAVLIALYGGLGSLFGIAIIIGSVAAGFGISNEQKWGYGLGIAMAFLPFLLNLQRNGITGILGGDLLALMFQIALVALLLHPQSREYQRIWFK